MALLGKLNRLRIVRFAQPGYYLDGGSHGEILLPGRYIPEGTKPGDTIEVMVYRRIADLTEQIIAVLEAAKDGQLPYGDASIPEEIREAFGVSKKAFKQAIGALYRERRIVIEPSRIRLVR
jgi:predicted RNA-binding protein (virulence factor B family)